MSVASSRHRDEVDLKLPCRLLYWFVMSNIYVHSSSIFFCTRICLSSYLFVNCSRLLNNTNLINGMFKKWNIHIPSDGSAEMSTGTRKEFSAVIAAMLVLSIGIGVAGIIGIVIACRKKKRYAKRLTRSM